MEHQLYGTSDQGLPIQQQQQNSHDQEQEVTADYRTSNPPSSASRDVRIYPKGRFFLNIP